MTLKEAYAYGQLQLREALVDDAKIDAWYLLEFATGINRTLYYLRADEQLSAEQEEKYREYISVRAKHIPLQHITGVQEFMGLEFCVDEHVLIPRQDTEVLAEQVLESLEPNMKILDMCTGSGCILISLLKHGTGLCGTGVDVSEDALKIAEKNAKKFDVNANFIKSNLFDEVNEQFDVIVSNPPYIPTAVIEQLQDEVRFYDPRLALDGKEDGLYFYREIVKKSIKYLRQNGKLYFEIGHDQAEEVKQLMEDAGFSSVQVKKDLAGLDRVVFGVYI